MMKSKLYDLRLCIVLTVAMIAAASAQSQPQATSPAASQSPQTSPSPAAAPPSQASPAPQGSQTSTTPTTSGSTSNAQQPSTANSQQTGTASSGNVIPAGTMITITPSQAIQNPQVGSTYPAQISQNVTGSNGSVLIPSGTPAQLTVVNAVSPTGAQEMALALKSIALNGHTYNVSASLGQSGGQAPSGNQQTGNGNQQQGNSGTQQQQQGNSGQSSGKSGGWTKVLSQILTQGSTVNVPSQAQLTFRLDQPLQLQ